MSGTEVMGFERDRSAGGRGGGGGGSAVGTRLVESYSHNHQSPLGSSSVVEDATNHLAQTELRYVEHAEFGPSSNNNQHHHPQHQLTFHVQHQYTNEQHQHLSTAQHSQQAPQHYSQHNNHNHLQHHQLRSSEQAASHRAEQRLVISGASEQHLTYNYEDVCGANDGWSMAPLDGDGRGAGQTNTVESVFCSFGSGGVSGGTQQAYSHLTSSGVHKMALKETSNNQDFNNNQQQQHHQSTGEYAPPSLATMSEGRTVEHAQDPFGQQQQTVGAHEQLFTDHPHQSNCYSCTELAGTYHQPTQQQQQQHVQFQNSSYEQTQQQASSFEMTIQTRDHQSSDSIVHIQRTGSAGMANSQQTSRLNSYEGHQTTLQPQLNHLHCHSHSHDVDHSSLKHSLDSDNFKLCQNELHPNLYESMLFESSQSQQTQPVEDIGYQQQPFRLQSVTAGYNSNNTIHNPATSVTEAPSQDLNKVRSSSKGRRGRPRKKGLRSKNKVNGKLWEFIRDLLLNERTNPSFIRWERREDGVFKFVQSDKVAKMWGERKQNPKMTYEKLSRAMRYYYKSKVLLPVFGRRLVYKFGPNATGWLPDTDDDTVY